MSPLLRTTRAWGIALSLVVSLSTAAQGAGASRDSGYADPSARPPQPAPSRAPLRLAPLRAPSAPPQASGSPTTYLVIVAGVGGEKRFADQFHGWSMALAAAARSRFGLADSLITYLAEDTTRNAVRVRGRSTKENLERSLAVIASRARGGDRVVLVLFGHGSAQDGPSRFNLPGPDLTDADLARALDAIKGATVVVANTASASGDFVKALAGKNRIVITATRSAREQNETNFPRFFVDALTSGTGDVDKDGRVSLLEAFAYARREVERVFEQGNLLATEHPLLDDDGDGIGHTDASEKGPDGTRARTFFLEPLGGTVAATDPRATQLLTERRAIETRIDSLRAMRASMTEERYQKELEPLMLQLAEKSRALRALEGRKP